MGTKPNNNDYPDEQRRYRNARTNEDLTVLGGVDVSGGLQENVDFPELPKVSVPLDQGRDGSGIVPGDDSGIPINASVFYVECASSPDAELEIGFNDPREQYAHCFRWGQGLAFPVPISRIYIHNDPQPNESIDIAYLDDTKIDDDGKVISCRDCVKWFGSPVGVGQTEIKEGRRTTAVPVPSNGNEVTLLLDDPFRVSYLIQSDRTNSDVIRLGASGYVDQSTGIKLGPSETISSSELCCNIEAGIVAVNIDQTEDVDLNVEEILDNRTASQTSP